MIERFINLLEQAGGRFKRAGKGYLGHALHRPDRNPSLSVFPGSEGTVLVKDHATGESWTAYRYLKEALGREDLAKEWLEMTRPWDPTRVVEQPARKKAPIPMPRVRVSYLKVQPSTPEWEASARKVMEEALAAIENGEHPRTLEYMEGRGLLPEYAYAAGLGALDKGIAIPVYDDHARLKSVKVRKWDDKGGRFVSVFSGRGNGYYFSPEFSWKPMTRVAIVEGELNAAAVYLALDLPTIGVPGASTGLSEEMVRLLKENAREVIILTDTDDAGRKLMERIQDQLVMGGYEMSRIVIPMEDRYHRDPMDILHDHGLDGLRERLVERVYNRGARLRKGTGARRQIAKMAARTSEGLNTKRALGNASGYLIVRRHASYEPPDEREALAALEQYLVREAMRKGLKFEVAVKAARQYMGRHGITGRTALFIISELNGEDTSSREARQRFVYQRSAQALFTPYRSVNEKGAFVFNMDALLRDAVKWILDAASEVMGFFRKVAEAIRKEREVFSAWSRGYPHLVRNLIRRPTSPPPRIALAAA